MVRDRRYRGSSAGYRGELVHHVLRVRLGSASCEACLVGRRLNEEYENWEKMDGLLGG